MLSLGSAWQFQVIRFVVRSISVVRFDNCEFAPDEGEFAPDDGKFAPDEGEFAPDDGKFAPDEGEFAPNDGKFASDEGEFAQVVKALLAAGADPQVRNPDSETPLHGAASEGHTEVSPPSPAVTDPTSGVNSPPPRATRR
eukprot:692888-Prorocentrum_minimum.AAC.1